MNLVFFARFRARSELLDDRSKFYFDKLEVIIAFIAASFAWCSPDIAYNSLSHDSSVHICRGSIKRRLEGTAMPPGSGWDRTNRFRESLSSSWDYRHLPSPPHIPIGGTAKRINAYVEA